MTFDVLRMWRFKLSSWVFLFLSAAAQQFAPALNIYSVGQTVFFRISLVPLRFSWVS